MYNLKKQIIRQALPPNTIKSIESIMTVSNPKPIFPQSFHKHELPNDVISFYRSATFFDSIDVYEYKRAFHYSHQIPINSLGFNTYIFMGAKSIVTFSRDLSMISHVMNEGDVVILPEITKTSNHYDDVISIDPLDDDPTYVLSTRASRKLIFDIHLWCSAVEGFALFRDNCGTYTEL
jgi:hypothetical protein